MSTTIQNQATANYEFEGTSGSISTSSNINTVVLNDDGGLSLSKTANTSTFSAGDIIVYTISITNNSSSYLNGVRIIDDIGGGNLAYVVGSASLTIGGLTYPVTPVATSPLTFTLQELNVGESMTLIYSCQVIFNLPSSVTSITNSVQGIGYTSTGTITGTTSTTILKKNELTLSKTSSESSVDPNETFDYQVTIGNSSGVVANITTITDQLASNYVLESATIKVGSNATVTLLSSDYTLSSSKLLTIYSVGGVSLGVPAADSMVITLTGYFV